MKNARMTQHVSLCIVCVAAMFATAAAGDTIMYQGVLSRPDATAVEDGAYNMDFAVYDVPEGGMPLWEETGLSVAVIQGAFAVELGLVTPDLITLFQDGEPRWLEVAVDLGEGVQIFDPRVPFTMMPYAAYAATLQGLTRVELDEALDLKADATEVYTQTDVDDALAQKADADDVYTRTEVDDALAQKADATEVYTQTEVDDALAQKADATEVYTQTEVDDALALKADATEVYTQTEVDDALALKADTEAVWLLGGNDSAAPLVLGCTEGFALELIVDNERALRIEPGATPNIIGGFSGNEVVGALGATISGGGNLEAGANRVTGNYGTVGGGINNQAGYDDGNPELKQYATVGGGQNNAANDNWTTVSGGWNNTANGWGATVGGGQGNEATANHATVAGGLDNIANTIQATVGGGETNTAGGSHATVGGGLNNTTGHDWTTIGGGENNTVEGSHAFVGGGYGNYASGGHTIIGGGESNTATNNWATVGGGNSNAAEGDYATVSGGFGNKASGNWATVGGGVANEADGNHATVGGGYMNTASGSYATVPGGMMNEAGGNNSFAAGRRARANHAGAFVWGDSTDAVVESENQNEFTARASGGVRFYSNSDLTAGVTLGAGSGSWSNASDRDLKENFAPVNALKVLELVAALPITTWNYKTQDAAIRHMGPMAQDLHAAFGLGECDTRISGIDADGIALAAIQGLHQRLAEKDREIEALRSELDTIKSLLLSGADE